MNFIFSPCKISNNEKELEQLLKKAIPVKKDPRESFTGEEEQKVERKQKENVQIALVEGHLKNQNQNHYVEIMYLGDPFRYSGCPLKGMPVFEEGENVEFDMNELCDLQIEEIYLLDKW